METQEKIEIAGTVSKIAGVMQNISAWLPFPLFTKTWRNYPEIFTERMRDDIRTRSRRAGVQNAEEFQAAAYLGIKHGLLESEYSYATIGGIGCEVLMLPDDYFDRVAHFVVGSKKVKVLSADQVNKEQRERFQGELNFSDGGER
ncbi:MAG: hypothetical protein M0P74_00990 [Syntrophales bacterium]|nr:hypothetical protein [Syntrophales bacterium]